jgi:N-acetyl-anhydromuramyl-L-alanine amidase AmpD
MTIAIVEHRLVDARYVPAKCVSQRRNKAQALCIHYTAGHTTEGAVRTLTKPPRRVGGKLKGASAHLVIGRDGEIVQLVPFNLVAWHAGSSEWGGRTRVNDWAIGIELVNRGPLPDGTWQPYPEAQLDALVWVATRLREHYPVRYVFGHEHCAPGRKRDPGPAFPWARLGGLSEEPKEISV